MDPVSHAVLGRVLVAAFLPGGSRRSLGEGGRTRPTGVAAASVLGALSPDIDFVLMPFGWDIYLRAHVVGTHSLLGALVTGLGSAALVRLFKRDSSLSRLSVAAIVGSMSHLVADVAAGARLRPAWPVSEAVVSLPLVAMGDPWTIAILAVGAVALWRSRWRLGEGGRSAARATVLSLGAFLVFKAVMLALMLGNITLPASDAGSRITEARWASLTEWFVFDRHGPELRQWQADVLKKPTLLLSIPVDEDAELARRSRSLATVRHFLAVHELAFPSVTIAPSGQQTVLWSDIRYCWRSTDASESSSPAAAIQCALWFGGSFDAKGQPEEQEVHLGSWIQRRPP